MITAEQVLANLRQFERACCRAYLRSGYSRNVQEMFKLLHSGAELVASNSELLATAARARGDAAVAAAEHETMCAAQHIAETTARILRCAPL